MGTYKQIYYQIVFASKNRKNSIPDTSCEELYRHIWGVVKNNNCKLYRINGTSDHIHIFLDLHPTTSLSDLIKNIKVSSNLWMESNTHFPEFEGWQEVYGAFTYSV